MNTTIYVSDGNGKGNDLHERERVLKGLRAYLYGGWTYKGWGSDPCGKSPGTGFLFEGPAEGGFGAEQLLARLASGLHFGHDEHEARDER